LKTTKVIVGDEGKNQKLITVYRMDEELAKLKMSYSFSADGKIGVDVKLSADASLPDLIRFGLTMGVNEYYTKAVYYGKGPWANYSDRNRSAIVGEYAGETKSLFTNYAMPQENGNRTGTRWLQLTDRSGRKGLRISEDPVFAFAVWPYSAESITAARHPYELEPQGFLTLHVDMIQTGLGGTLSNTLEKYLIKPGEFTLRFAIGPAEMD
jgi:beta-galactosidase